jgi:hypothetical protein
MTDFFGSSSNNGDISEVVDEAVDLVTLNDGNPEQVRPLLETISSVVSQFSPNLTKAEESSIRGNISAAVLIALKTGNFVPQVTNNSVWFSSMLLKENTLFSETALKFAKDFFQIYQNPSIGYEYFKTDEKMDELAEAASHTIDALTALEDRNCKMQMMPLLHLLRAFVLLQSLLSPTMPPNSHINPKTSSNTKT